jgi:hypothetical protein
LLNLSYVSGKAHYFGNDGGILAFKEFVTKKELFSVKVLEKDDMSVPHILIVLTRIQPPAPVETQPPPEPQPKK